MSVLDPFLHEYWIAWRIVPALTLCEAACLLGNIDPLRGRNNRILPSEVEALRTALEQSVKTGELAPFELWGYDAFGDLHFLHASEPLHGERVADCTTVKNTALAAWADARGIEHYWTNGTTEEGGRLRDISHYPAELRAAIEAFEAVSKSTTATVGRSPRKCLLDWLEANRPDLGSNARDRIATVANWQPGGGAPKTPGG